MQSSQGIREMSHLRITIQTDEYQTTPLLPLNFGIMHSTQFDFSKHFPSDHLTSYITEQWSATMLCDKPLRYAHPDQLFDMKALCFGEHCTILLSSSQGFGEHPSNLLDYHPLWTSTQPLQELQQGGVLSSTSLESNMNSSTKSSSSSVVSLSCVAQFSATLLSCFPLPESST
nr:hypothetical protein Iba_chr14eCG9910 [Ipomoea batatas]